jgi:hypothetical protein
MGHRSSASTLWQSLLAAEKDHASLRMLADEQKAQRLMFGTREICTVAEPLFITATEERQVLAGTKSLMSAWRKLDGVLRRERTLRALLALSAEEERILACDQQPFAADVVGRMDGFLADGAFRVVEYNAESPGGIGYGDALARIFEGLPVMQQFRAQRPCRGFHGLERTLRALLQAHTQRIGRTPTEPVRIAITDRTDVPTVREFELCAAAFTALGAPSEVVDVQALRFENGVLHAGNFRPDIVYKRVLVQVLLGMGGADHPLARAVAAGAVTCASGFGVHIMFRKELFALLAHPLCAELLDVEEQRAVERHVPWSAFVMESAKAPDGSALLPWIRREREQLVLKPGGSYGGSGVVLGWLVDDAAWETAIREALSTPSLVQRRVKLPLAHFALLDQPGVTKPFRADLDPYVWNGCEVEGFGARLASGDLLNVTAGGGSAVPVFTLEDE